MEEVKVNEKEESEIFHTPLYLNEHVEFITGANDQPMLYHQQRKKYIRISPFSIEVLQLMDGTRTLKEIVNILQSKFSTDESDEEFIEKVYQFFYTLRKADVLNIKPLTEKKVKKVIGNITKKPILRLPLFKSLDGITSLLLSIYHFLPAICRKYSWYVLGVGSLLIYILFFLFSFSLNAIQVNLMFVLPFVFLHLIIHELSHAVVTKGYGISIREAGFALLYYFIPVAYVDRTDTYRLKDKKSRIQIALAGPFSDFLIGGIWAFIALVASHDGISQFAQLVALLQLLLVLNNTNLLLPTDGYHAAEALIGEISLRRKALKYFFSVITFRNNPQYERLSKSRKIVYFGYTLVSISYFLILLAGTIFIIQNVLVLKG